MSLGCIDLWLRTCTPRRPTTSHDTQLFGLERSLPLGRWSSYPLFSTGLSSGFVVGRQNKTLPRLKSDFSGRAAHVFVYALRDAVFTQLRYARSQ